MDALEAIKCRKSIRNFDGAMILDKDLEKIVDAGRVAPSARAEHPWDFIVIKDKTALSNLAGLTDYGKFIKNCGAAIVVVCKDTKYYLEDGCAATENILVAAAALGIGSCWVAGDKKSYAGGVLRMFGVPAGHKLVSILALGYPSKKTSSVEKRPLKEILHWEKF